MLWVELAGVLTVGTLSLVEPDWFPDASVWSDYGIGYGFVPAVLPIAGPALAAPPEEGNPRRHRLRMTVEYSPDCWRGQT